MDILFLLRPFPKIFHIVIWILYFGWIGRANISLFGVNHLKVLLLVMPLMLGIAYVNRYWLRKFVRVQMLSKGMLGWMAAMMLTICVALYLALYVWPSSLSWIILPEPAENSIWPYVLDFVAFYWSFAWKGIGLGLAEITVGVLRWRRLTAEQKRSQTVIYKRKTELKRWLAHFQGNIAQHMLLSISSNRKSRKRNKAYLALSSRCVQLMARRSMTVPLAEELDSLRELATLFVNYQIVLNLPEQTYDHEVVPMMLLGLFENVCKHGEFGSDAAQAVFTVSATADRMVMHTENQIAAESAWIYQDGGTGLERLVGLLDLHYGSKASLQYEQEDDRFRTWLIITFNNGYKQRNKVG